MDGPVIVDDRGWVWCLVVVSVQGLKHLTSETQLNVDMVMHVASGRARQVVISLVVGPLQSSMSP
jgi:hypothetical protein